MSAQMKWMCSDGTFFDTEDDATAHVEANVGTVFWEIFVDSAASSDTPPTIPVQNSSGSTVLLNGDTMDGLTLLDESTVMLPAGGSTVINHTSDGDNNREVFAWFENQTTYEEVAWESDNAEDYVFEDESSCTILKGAIQLLARGGYTRTTNNFADDSQAIASDEELAHSGNDNLNGTIWYNIDSAGNQTRWWGIDAGRVVACSSGQIRWYTSSYSADFRVQGSDDGVTWTTLGTFEGIYGRDEEDDDDDDGNDEYQTWSLPNPEFYRYWRYDFFDHHNSSYTVIREGRFYEDRAAGAGFTTTPLWVHNAFTQTLPTVSWGKINWSCIHYDEPSNTTIRILVSFDGGVTWRGYSLGMNTWVAYSLNDIETQGMTPLAFNNLFASEWEAPNGFVPGTGSIDLAISLRTTNNQRTPQVSGFSFEVESTTYLASVADTDAAEIRKLSPTQTELRNRLSQSKTFRVRMYR